MDPTRTPEGRCLEPVSRSPVPMTWPHSRQLFSVPLDCCTCVSDTHTSEARVTARLRGTVCEEVPPPWERAVLEVLLLQGLVPRGSPSGRAQLEEERAVQRAASPRPSSCTEPARGRGPKSPPASHLSGTRHSEQFAASCLHPSLASKGKAVALDSSPALGAMRGSPRSPRGPVSQPWPAAPEGDLAREHPSDVVTMHLRAAARRGAPSSRITGQRDGPQVRA